MNLKHTITDEEQGLEFNFHVDKDSGSLIIKATDNDLPIQVPHLVAIELIELLRNKLYAHEDSKSIFKRLFR